MEISHKYCPEILIPYAGVEDNINLIINRVGEYTTSDGVIVEAELLGSLHALSNETAKKIEKLYGCGVFNFMLRWYERLGSNFCTNEFLNIRLTKKE